MVTMLAKGENGDTIGKKGNSTGGRKEGETYTSLKQESKKE